MSGKSKEKRLFDKYMNEHPWTQDEETKALLFCQDHGWKAWFENNMYTGIRNLVVSGDYTPLHPTSYSSVTSFLQHMSNLGIVE